MILQNGLENLASNFCYIGTRHEMVNTYYHQGCCQSEMNAKKVYFVVSFSYRGRSIEDP